MGVKSSEGERAVAKEVQVSRKESQRSSAEGLNDGSDNRREPEGMLGTKIRFNAIQGPWDFLRNRILIFLITHLN